MGDLEYRTLLVTVDDGVGTISLNRPHRHNAVDDQMHEDFTDAWSRVSRHPDVRVIVLRGEGASFCSGRDISQLGERVAGESDLSFVRRHQQGRLAQLYAEKPVIAELRGHALGGGLELALGADIRIAASDVSLAFPEIHYGLMTDTGGSPLATALAGPSRAKLMLMTGRRIDAATALAWGLVDQVVEPEELASTVRRLAVEIAEKDPEPLAMIKQTVNGMWQGQVLAAFDRELFGQVAIFGSGAFARRKAARTTTGTES